MKWWEFKEKYSFAASVAGVDGEVTGEQLGQVYIVCRDNDVACQVGPNGDQIFLGGSQANVVQALDTLNATGGRGSIQSLSQH